MNKLFILLLLITSCSQNSISTYDHYKNFAELKSAHELNQDYKIEFNKSKSQILVMSIHGCLIEQGTTELAQLISGNKLNYYNFCGVKTANTDNKFLLDSLLHITSTHFDEPTLLEMTKEAKVCLSLHGYPGDKADFCLGGRDEHLRKKILEKLKSEFPEYTSCDLCCPPYLGLARKNPVNRCEYQGVQIEMGPKVRKNILENSSFKQKLATILRSALNDQ